MLNVLTESINSENITRYMKLLSNAGNMSDVSDETKERIYALEKQFKEEFYVAAKGGSKQIDADEIFFEFDEKWNKEHPEFYDMKKLLG